MSYLFVAPINISTKILNLLNQMQIEISLVRINNIFFHTVFLQVPIQNFKKNYHA